MDANLNPPVYIYDPSIDVDMDWELRVLFVSCWPGALFRTKRYNMELPAHRWIIQGADHSIVAHLAVHDKLVRIDTQLIRVGGVAEVCVQPSHRGKKLVSQLLTAAHGWMENEGVSFSLLFGRTDVYASQGYAQVPNPCRCYIPDRKCWETRFAPGLLVRSIANASWPETGILDLRSPSF